MQKIMLLFVFHDHTDIAVVKNIVHFNIQNNDNNN